ncbi:MAG: zinc-ribbon domain-containing protein [bacterium]
MAGNEDVPICPDCGHLTRYIPSKNSYWCTNCSKFIDVQDNSSPSPSNQPGEPAEETSADQTDVCPKCGNQPRYIQQYDRYWCEHCSEYLPEEFGKTHPELASADDQTVQEIPVAAEVQQESEQAVDIQKETATEQPEAAESSPETEIELPSEPVAETNNQPEVESPRETPELICPQCGNKVRYLEQYDRYWCDTCTEYMAPDFGTEEYLSAETESSPSQHTPDKGQTKLICPNCGNEVRYLPQYERYWCDSCADYMSPDFGKTDSEPQPDLTPQTEDIIPQEAISEKTGQTFTCPQCQGQLRYVELYDKYWCDNCAKYIEIETPVSDESELPITPDQETEPIPESETSLIEDIDVKSLDSESIDNLDQEIEIPQQPSVVEEQTEPSPEISFTPPEEPIPEHPSQEQELDENFEGEVIICPKCGHVTRYVEAYDRYWCDNCSEYLTPESSEEAHPPDQDQELEQQEIEPELEEPEVEYTPEDEELFKSLESDVLNPEDMETQEIEQEASTPSAQPETTEPPPELPEKQEQALLCPKCDQPVRYVEQYDRFWCDHCSEYMPVEFGKSAQTTSAESPSTPPSSGAELVCPNCGNDVVFNQQYERYWCENCKNYMPLDFGEEEVYIEAAQPIQSEEEESEPEQPEQEISADINIQHDVTPEVPESEQSIENTYSEQLITPIQSGEQSLAQETAEKELLCPECSSTLRFIEQYQRYWCDNCSKYMPADFGIQAKKKYFCPKCGVELARCHPCKKYWCQQCDQCYSPDQLSG